MKLLHEKVVVVTGTGKKSSIGLAVVGLFIQHGAAVAMLDLMPDRDRQDGAMLGERCRRYTTDVSDQSQCEQTLSRVAADFGGVDILVNSAGVVHGTRILDITEQEYDQVLDNNLRGNFLMAQAVLPYFRAGGEGNIVCLSSIAGQTGGGVFGSSHYAAAKSGIFGLAKALARELAPEGIRVNAIAPGPVDNDFTDGRMTPEIKNDIAKNIPLGRLGTPEDIANACLFLASDLSSFVTGVVLDVNGGLLIH